MLEWIKTTLQTILDTYKENNITNLETVSVVDINTLKKGANVNADTILQLTFRELEGDKPNMPIMDRMIMGTMYVDAPEDEKVAVQTIITDFINTYNATEVISIEKILYMSNIIPLGSPDNNGSKIQQSWSFGLNAVVIGSLTNIYDRSIIISTTPNSFISSDFEYWNAQNESNRETYVGNIVDLTASDYQIGYAVRVTDGTLPVSYDYYVVTNTGVIGEFNVLNGLVSYNFEKITKYAEYPKSTIQSGKVMQYIIPRITFAVLDYKISPTVDLKDIIYNESYSYLVTVKSGVKTKEFNAFLINSGDSISENGFPLLRFTFERS